MMSTKLSDPTFHLLFQLLCAFMYLSSYVLFLLRIGLFFNPPPPNVDVIEVSPLCRQLERGEGLVVFRSSQIHETSREISICESVGGSWHGKFWLWETDGDSGGGVLLPMHLLTLWEWERCTGMLGNYTSPKPRKYTCKLHVIMWTSTSSQWESLCATSNEML